MRTLLLTFAASAIATAALAQAPIATRTAQDAPPPAAEPVTPLDQPSASQEDATRWGREVLARANGQLPPSEDRRDAVQGEQQARRGCVRNPDRSEHGTGSVSVGTGGYRAADIYATAPVGDCGQVSIGVSTSQGGRHFYGGPYGYGGYGPYGY